MIHKLFTGPLDLVVWLGREIDQVARAEQDDEKTRWSAELALLYRQLESGEITEEEFEDREEWILDRMDEPEAADEEDSA